MEKPVVRFLREERAQGSMEYVILLGGIIILAVMVANSYLKLARSTIDYMEVSNADTFDRLNGIINQYLSGNQSQ